MPFWYAKETKITIKFFFRTMAFIALQLLFYTFGRCDVCLCFCFSLPLSSICHISLSVFFYFASSFFFDSSLYVFLHSFGFMRAVSENDKNFMIAENCGINLKLAHHQSKTKRKNQQDERNTQEKKKTEL